VVSEAVDHQQRVHVNPAYVAACVGKLSTGTDEELKGAAQALLEAGEQALPELQVALVLGSGRARHAAAWVLGRLGGPRAIGVLREALHDPCEAVRVISARALGQTSSEEARQALHDAAREDPSPKVQRVAQHALARLGAD